MKHKLISLFCLLAFFAACSKDDPVQTPEPEPEPEPVPVSEQQTVLVYIASQNSLSGLVKADLDEMQEGMANIDAAANNLLAYVDGKSTPCLIHFTKDEDGTVVKDTIATYDEQNSLDTDVMKEVLSTVFTRYEAGRYGIVFWSHADGWIASPSSSRWWGQDGNKYMDIADLNEALQEAPHFDYILFDACFMQSAEVAYALRQRCDYLIGSPTEIPGPGAPYQKVVPALFDRDNPAVRIAESYFGYYKDKYNGGTNNSNLDWTAGVSIGVLKTSALEGLAAATAQVLPKYIADGENPPYAGVMCYDNRSSAQYYHDLERFIYNLTGGNGDYTAWKAEFDKAMVYWDTTDTNFSAFGSGRISMDPDAGGLSGFIPRSTKASETDFYRTLEWYTAAGWNTTGW